MVFQKSGFKKWFLEWAVSETCFQKTGFSVSDFQEGDFENAIPRIGFR